MFLRAIKKKERAPALVDLGLRRSFMFETPPLWGVGAYKSMFYFALDG